ncbi:MAG: nucleoside-diphosphate sugar epimerase/dehydratase [Veillonellales bacterium]
MRRRLVSLALVVADILVVSIVPFIALYLRFDGIVDAHYYSQLVSYLPAIVLIQLTTFYLFRLYHRLWRYASIHELVVIVGAVTVSSAVLVAYSNIINSILPGSIYVLSWLFTIVCIGGSRLGLRILHYLIRQTHSNPIQNVLIIGAGDAGAMIAREITQRYYETKKIVGFIDDSAYKSNQILFGARVLGPCSQIHRIVQEQSISEIIIAMPSVEGSIVRQIVQECKTTQCNVQIVPGIYELIDGKVSVHQLRNVDLEDLLRREPVQLNAEDIAGYIKGHRVLVTGAGGSIGSELCRQIARFSPEQILLLGKGENSIYEIHQELGRKYPDLNLSPIIADVRDEERINDIFATYRPEIVFHAAAHKHVPLMELQPLEAVKNNVFGTKNVAQAADRYETKIFIMISTDKAVNPTSVMGCTKRVAEMIIQSLNRESKTKYTTVRFGNVLGSRGSVIPLFKKQIAAGGPITITHPDIIRYFMTIPEASQLVLQAGALAQGGEVFVLDMGKPVKILDMACDLIELSGLVPYKDIKFEFTGLRPGEKMFEELLTAEEGTQATKYKKIFRAKLRSVDEKKLSKVLFQFQNQFNDSEEVKRLLQKLITVYKPYHKKDSQDSSSGKLAIAEEPTVQQETPAFYPAESMEASH